MFYNLFILELYRNGRTGSSRIVVVVEYLLSGKLHREGTLSKSSQKGKPLSTYPILDEDDDDDDDYTSISNSNKEEDLSL